MHRFPAAWFFVCAIILPGTSAADDDGNPFREIQGIPLFARNVKRWENVREYALKRAVETKQPSYGRKLFPKEGGFLETQGIPKASILTQRNEWKSWAFLVPPPLLDPPYTMRIYDDEKDSIIDLEVPANRDMGSYSYGVIEPYLDYLRGEIGTRDENWDENILTACLSFQKEPELAETAMFHAVESGYPADALRDWFAVIFQTYTPTGPAKELDRFLAHFQDTEIPWIYVPCLQAALTTAGHVDQMERIADEAIDNCVYDHYEVDRFRSWLENGSSWPDESLLERATKQRGRSLVDLYTPRLTPKIDKPYHIDVPPGKYNRLSFSPEYDTPPNLHYHMSFRAQGTGKHERWGTTFEVNFINIYNDGKPPKNMRFSGSSLPYPQRYLDVHFRKLFDHTEITTSANSLPGVNRQFGHGIDIPYVEDPILLEAQRREFEKSRAKFTWDPELIELDLIRYRNELGIFINGDCYLHQPNNPDREQEFHIRMMAVGMKVDIEKQGVWEINEPEASSNSSSEKK